MVIDIKCVWSNSGRERLSLEFRRNCEDISYCQKFNNHSCFSVFRLMTWFLRVIKKVTFETSLLAQI